MRVSFVKTAVLLYLGLSFGCSHSATPPAELTATLTAAMQASAEGWNRGDLESHVAPYAGDATFMSKAGPISIEQMKESFSKRYFKDGKPKQMLSFEELVVHKLGHDHALLTGRFILQGGGEAEQTGRFTLIWRRTAAGWRIIHDHSS